MTEKSLSKNAFYNVVYKLSLIHIFDSAESPLHNVRLEFEKNYPNLGFVPVIGDVRMKERLRMVFETYQPQIIVHAAAYKHVPLMEENPSEAVLVNVVGSRQEMCIRDRTWRVKPSITKCWMMIVPNTKR